MQIVFLQPSKDEMCEAAAYYETKAAGLGSAFLDEVERAVSGIKELPYSGRLLRNGVRRRLVKRFPFGILYAVDDNKIVVLAVMHLRRRPSYWASRLSLLARNDNKRT
jgi:plasmid stabilization system protein ParE